ncbi:hypothetical protein BK138_09705 [Paenibacillus rhizosphaerae]|uniref:Uncharacterized protein n=1 Tax=Paenibacillus rhizosphaerae TaxID=297318 RepID=A0A1R1F484_9BACL|nr:hypothetical protein [Paenibacillus rhizosphaerae]OMF58756.1 hypothetical protein BK138_09705 [Paenibacillus rhizosphaerae]
MLKYIALPIIFAVCFVLIQTGIQTGLGMYTTQKHTANMMAVYDPNGAEPLPSTVKFEADRPWITPQKITVWLISLVISAAAAFLFHRLVFKT